MMESLVNFYPCIDIEETTKFYVEVLQLKLHVDQGKARIFDTGYGYLGFCQYDHQQLASYTCISFNVKDRQEVDQYYRALKTLGVDILSEPCLHEEFNVYSFFFTDPNGYKLEIQKISPEE